MKEYPIWRVSVKRTNGYFIWHYRGPLRNVIREAKRMGDTIISIDREGKHP